MWNENWLVWLHLFSYLSCYEENKHSLCFLVTFAICYCSMCWQPCWKMWSLIRLIAFPYSSLLILDQYYCTLLLQSLFFLNPSADKLLKENDSVWHATVPSCQVEQLPVWVSFYSIWFYFYSLPICLLPTKGKLCQITLTDSSDKADDFLVKGNALDTVYLDFSNAFSFWIMITWTGERGMSRRIRGWVGSPLKWDKTEKSLDGKWWPGRPPLSNHLWTGYFEYFHLWLWQKKGRKE